MKFDFPTVALFLLGIIGLYLSVRQHVVGVGAIREISASIKNSDLQRQLHQRITDANQSSIELTSEELFRLREDIKALTLQMKKEKRKEILETLEEGPQRNQINYINRLLQLSGLDVPIKLKAA